MKKLLLVVSCLALSIGANASVNSEVKVASVNVNISDINLTTVAGQERLHRRITQAAKSVCGRDKRREVSSLKVLMENKSCIKQAVTEAIEDSGAIVATR